ncbi:MAG: N-formylglutamate amidohydrolase [Prevotella sp.]|nr:N-formylglutamate amidohydrolase [Prevotella sp.]
MKKKKVMSWDERHLNGDLSYHTFLDSLEDVSFLHEVGTKVALRTLKYHLEEEIGYELSDEAFLAIFFRVVNLLPACPHGGWSFQDGFVAPMAKLLQEYKLDCGLHPILKFFRVYNEDNRHYKNLILHIPHSSISFPNGKNNFDDLDEEERLLIDYYTDELFVPEQETNNIYNIIFPYCRLYCDVERLINDPLEKEGLGLSYSRWVPRRDGYGKVIRSYCGKSEAFALYTDFHSEVSKKIVGLSGSILLIDCHSFSALPNLLDSNPPDIDICIGYNDDETRPSEVVIGNIVQHFKSKGYKVGKNDPFSNSKTFSVPTKYHSIMIEVNKRLYINEQTLEKSEGFEKLKQDIQSLYGALVKAL